MPKVSLWDRFNIENTFSDDDNSFFLRRTIILFLSPCTKRLPLAEWKRIAICTFLQLMEGGGRKG